MKTTLNLITLLILLVITPKASALGQVINPELAQTVFANQELNKQKLKTAKFVWTVTGEQPATKKTPKLSQFKIHTRWISKEKFAVHSTEEITTTTNLKSTTEKRSKTHTFDGKTHSITDKLNNPTQITLKKREAFNPIDDWLALVKWDFYGTQEDTYAIYLESPNYKIIWSKITLNNQPLVQATFQSLKHKALKTIHHYDPAQGYAIVSEQDFSRHGIQYLHRIYENKQVVPGLFMPTQVNIEFAYPKTGIHGKSTQYTLLLDQCTFNQPIPDKIFTTPLTPGIKVIDTTSGKKKEYIYKPKKIGPSKNRKADK